MASDDEIKGTWTSMTYKPTQSNEYQLKFSTIIQETLSGDNTVMQIQKYNDGADKNKRCLIKFKLPPEPTHNAKIARVLLHLYIHSSGSASATEYVHVHKVTTTGWKSPTWTKCKLENQWNNAGGDYDSSTNYGLGSDGVVDIDGVTIPDNGWRYFELTGLIDNDNLSWGDEINILLRFRTEGGGTQYYISYATDEYATEEHRPYVTVYYWDPYPDPVTDLAVKPHEGDKKLPSFNWGESEKEDIYGMSIYDVTNSAWVQTNRSEASSPYIFTDVNGDKEYTKPTHLLTAPTENTLTTYALYSFDEAGYDSGDYLNNSSKSNEVKVIRPDVSSLAFINSGSVGDEVSLYVLAKGSNLEQDNLKDMTIDIMWGDETITKGIPHHQAAISSVSSNEVTVDDGSGFEPGEKVILYNTTDYEEGEILTVVGNTIYLTSAPSNSYASGGYMVTRHSHIYNGSATYDVGVQAYNDQGFASDVTSTSITISTASPTVDVKIVPNNIQSDDEFRVSLTDTIVKDNNETISSYGLRISSLATSDLTTNSSGVFQRKATTLNPMTATSNIKLTSTNSSESRKVHLYGLDNTGNPAWEEITTWSSGEATSATSFSAIYAVSVESSGDDITITQSSDGYGLGSITGDYTDAFSGEDLTIVGSVVGNSTYTGSTTLYFDPIYSINLLDELADGVENIEIPHSRNYKLSEGWLYKVLKMGTEKARIIKLSGTARTISGYTDCSISSATVSFSGTNGEEYDDILLLDALLSQADHKVTLNYNGRDYTGWIVDLKTTVTGGLSYRSWSATLVVV